MCYKNFHPSRCARRSRRLLAAAAAALMLFAAPAGLPGIQASAADVDSLRDQQEELKAQEEQLKQEKAEAENDLEVQEAYIDNLNEQISNTTQMIEQYDSQVRELNASIEELNQTIADKEQEIADQEAAIAVRYEELQQRLRAISKTGNMSTLQMLMDTTSYTDYLIKSKMMEMVAENDQELMNEMEAAIQQINKEQEALSQDKAAVSEQLEQAEALKAQADSQKAELDVLYGKANKARATLEGQIDEYESEIASAKDEQAQLEAQIKKIIKESAQNSTGSSGSYGGGTMAWPVPAVRNISSGYGPRWGTTHRGVDISGGAVAVYGQDIVAAEDGVVIWANSTNWWGGGYGYHVIVDHGVDANGNRISTLYAHCSYVAVSVGQTVTRGETLIGRAGNSGDVTGPHLHFEVRVNGEAVDPIKNGYLTAP